MKEEGFVGYLLKLQERSYFPGNIIKISFRFLKKKKTFSPLLIFSCMQYGNFS